MQKKCRKCGTKFTVKTSEDYCPECMEVMTPPPAGTKLEVRECEGCGEPFEYFRKPQGRPRKYCPDCAIKFCHKSKKEVEEEANMTTVDSNKTEDRQKIDSKETVDRQKEDSNKETVYVPTAEHMAKMYGNIEHDAVNHPSHYTRGKIEVIDFIEDQQLPYHLGNVIKYIARAGYKGDKLEDLKKARWYLDRYINEVMGNGTL
nr:DUF3310 domain-containing protein [uncultured Veillonella sp.]DAI01292.1 MAG TPA: nucelotide kinase [Caudoviricetes sp.]